MRGDRSDPPVGAPPDETAATGNTRPPDPGDAEAARIEQELMPEPDSGLALTPRRIAIYMGVVLAFVAALYIGLGITTVLILRKMSKRYRERGRDDMAPDDDVPYGPREPAGDVATHEEVTVS